MENWEALFTEEELSFFDNCGIEERKWVVDESLNLAFSKDVDETYSVNGVENYIYTNVQIPSVYLNQKVASITYKAFKNQTSLISVTIPKSITYIGYAAFSGCTSLVKVDLPNGINKINPETFSGCTSLLEVAIPLGVTRIGSSVFYNSALKRIIIPNSVEHISRLAFIGCPLKDIYFDGTMQQWEAIDKAEDWKDETQLVMVHCSDGNILK